MSVIVTTLKDMLMGWPLIAYVIGASLVCTIAFSFVQLFYFIASIKNSLMPKVSTKTSADMNSFQAFINSLNAALGNGSIGGVAVAIAVGGPGAALWMVIVGFLLMAVRYAEIYLTTFFGRKKVGTGFLGGPMVYLEHVYGGRYLAYAYAFLCTLFGFIGGNAIQTNTIGLSLSANWGLPVWFNALILTLFVAYIMAGGATRIVQASMKIVPIKVGIFFGSTIMIIMYHTENLFPALKLIVQSALHPAALAGGVIGFTIQQALSAGINAIVFATEAGLGTAAVMYGGSESVNPVADSIGSMFGVFISTCVCFLVALSIVITGVWDSGLTSTALTGAAFHATFGSIGGVIISFLSVTFGMGVLVAYAYITRAVWLYCTGGRGEYLFVFLYCFVACIGALAKVELLWQLADIMNALLLLVNLFGIMMLLPLIRRGLLAYRKNLCKNQKNF